MGLRYQKFKGKIYGAAPTVARLLGFNPDECANVNSTNVQGALEEIDSNITDIHTDLDGKIDAVNGVIKSTLNAEANVNVGLLLNHTTPRGTAPESDEWRSMTINGSDYVAEGTMYHTKYANGGSKSGIRCYGPTGTAASIEVGFDANGNLYTAAPTPGSTDNSGKIATTKYVREYVDEINNARYGSASGTANITAGKSNTLKSITTPNYGSYYIVIAQVGTQNKTGALTSIQLSSYADNFSNLSDNSNMQVMAIVPKNKTVNLTGWGTATGEVSYTITYAKLC